MGIIHTTTDKFDSVIQKNSLVLVDFWASWCRYCTVITPIMEQLAVDYNGKVAIVKVDADAEPGLTERFGVQGLPTVILFKNGEVIATEVGANSQEHYSNLIEQNL